MLERVKSVRVQESFDFRNMKMNLRTPYTGRVDDRFAGARCDYLLPAHLQYPNYAQRPQEDFLKPYFELYLAGRQIAFERGEVVVFMR